MLLAISPSFILFIPIAIFTSYPSTLISNLGFQYFDFKEIFSIFGARLGFDLFLTLLFITGMIILWNYLKELKDIPPARGTPCSASHSSTRSSGFT